MHLGYCPGGEVNEKLIEFYRARARGGTGLIIVGGCGIDQIGNAHNMVQLDDDRFIPGLQSLVAAVHSEGAKVIPQLYHAGRYAVSAHTGHRSVAPSPVASKLTGETPLELTQTMIDTIVASYVGAAKRAQSAGFDGIEILASAGYLISQFLSPITNLRTDRYGGDLNSRMTFAREVITAVREAVGASMPIIVRVAGNDFIPGSNTNTEAQAFCRMLATLGVDAIDVTGGWHETSVPQLTMNVPPGAYTYLAQGIKEAVSIPVIACNRINSVELADSILQAGKADFIGMARQLLADPDLPVKPLLASSTPVRPCIGCNQGCLDAAFRMQPVTCLVNAEAGREAEKVPVSTNPNGLPEQILVIGAGPAGLEYARVAASNGHKVTVWEASPEPGGQLVLAAAPPGRQDFKQLIHYLTQSCKVLGVELKYDQMATPESVLTAVKNKKFSTVVIATGAVPIAPELSVAAGSKVLQAWDVLAGKVATGDHVVIVGGGAVGVETALLLAEPNTIDAATLRFLLFQHAETERALHQLLTHTKRSITLLELAKGLGRDIGPSTRWSMLADLKRYGINCQDQTKVIRITPDGVQAETASGIVQFPADTVILAVGSRPCNDLFQALQAKIPHIICIGDAQNPRKALDAIHQAYATANFTV